MNQHAIQNLTLFDLLARSWRRPSAIADLRFSADGSTVAFTCVDGTVAIAAVADQEPPESRIRVSGDLGQMTIRPREKPPAPLIATAALGDGDVPLASYLSSGFVVGTAAGEAVHLGADGNLMETLVKIDGPVVAVDHNPRTAITAVSNGRDVFLAHGQGDAVPLRLGPTPSTDALAFSPGGRRLAHGLGDGLSIWAVDADAAPIRDVSFSARPVSIRWSGDGTWLACGLEAGGFALVSAVDGRTDIVEGFPSPVRTVCWSLPENAVFASGAFRIAGWSMTAPPLDGDTSGALETGQAGLVPVETVAAHPEKKLIAAGYANGRITIAQIGARDELLVRPLGSAVTALAWSGDGRHLAVGVVDGTAAIVTFPAQMFK
ncbi:WD40 repeat domain-containing protein [Mesorhizobium sp.]|uniref:WD40 repeat domain-containing protein n=1 Tax=Mesorhizobium sp. TaxID=1871066 RepID=UPI000FE455C3|nr:WD40 repeat domain-containing protein [Mesorhizobium sp.]RWK40855.1 MAG: WD40 repeat domain-containing protein [Mesorhizobium sp.]RWK70435.1 MAG: WD40 repeat domain-containing protein [Mesorhizobium sp.]RWK80697.1 MAG: WD40 repeat domain-containing protein [Mesorhizobium sp.]RWK83253.1 MAG: WD40 repeat domain-containing protein [Mesorhizobium sp.]RWL09154.1 MAG: WD40 repeat domain-containing protein [Mesorhizobium sp.]